MATKYFDCEECGAHGKIVFKEKDFMVTDVAYCPFCSADVSEVESEDEDE